MLVAELPGDDVLGIGDEACLGSVSGLQVLPHEDAVGADLDVHDVVVLDHGVGGLLADDDLDVGSVPDDVRDVLLRGGVGGLGLGCRHGLSAAGGVASSLVQELDGGAAFLTDEFLSHLSSKSLTVIPTFYTVPSGAPEVRTVTFIRHEDGPRGMMIPAVFAERRDEKLLASVPDEEAVLPAREGDVPFQEITGLLPRGDSRGTAVVADMDSLRSGEFREGVVKGMRIRGSDIWFMTCIRDADDLMDAFNTTADLVIAPMHLISGEEDAKDIVSVSDSVIPAAIASKGGVLRGDWRVAGVREALMRLESLGFYRMCVLDMDGTVTDGDWTWIADQFPSTVPFVSDPSIVEGYRFKDVIAPLRPASRR